MSLLCLGPTRTFSPTLRHAIRCQRWKVRTPVRARCDVQLQLNNGRLLSASSWALCVASPVFAAFFTRWFVAQNGPISLSCDHPEALEAIVSALNRGSWALRLRNVADEFLGHGYLALTGNNVQEVFIIADMYEMHFITEICKRFMIGKTDTVNCLRLIGFARRHPESLGVVLHAAEDFLLNDTNFVAISRRREFSRKPLRAVTQYVEKARLHVRREHFRLRATTTWLSRHHLPEVVDDFLSKVDMQLILPSEMELEASRWPALWDNPIFQEAYDWSRVFYHPRNKLRQPLLKRSEPREVETVLLRFEEHRSGGRYRLSPRVVRVGQFLFVLTAVNGRMLCERFDTMLGHWMGLASPPCPAMLGVSMSRYQKGILMAGGAVAYPAMVRYLPTSIAHAQPTNQLFFYDILYNSWTRLAEGLPISVAHAGMTAGPHGWVYVAGGIQHVPGRGPRPCARALAFRPNFNQGGYHQYQRVPDMMSARYQFNLHSVGQRIYAVGGFLCGKYLDEQGVLVEIQVPNSLVEFYDTTTRQWSSINRDPSLLPVVVDGSCVGDDGKIYTVDAKARGAVACVIVRKPKFTRVAPGGHMSEEPILKSYRHR